MRVLSVRIKTLFHHLYVGVEIGVLSINTFQNYGDVKQRYFHVYVVHMSMSVTIEFIDRVGDDGDIHVVVFVGETKGSYGDGTYIYPR
eukprot:SAG11_NODE_385_length_9888_cov_13.326387_9_plen_88_part_00